MKVASIHPRCELSVRSGGRVWLRLLGIALLVALLAACSSVEVPEEEVLGVDDTEQAEMLSGSPVETEMSLEEALAAWAQEKEKAQGDADIKPQFLNTTGVLMDDVKDYGIVVGVVFDRNFGSAEKKERYKKHIRNAVRSWLEPLRSMPDGDAITNRVFVKDDTKGASGSRDITVVFQNQTGRSKYNSFWEEITMFSDDHDNFLVYLHEFGHAFGLGDTYIEDVWTCKDGQYTFSVMCDHEETPQLTADDIRGIKYQYCKAFSSCDRTDYLDMYGGPGGDLMTSECEDNEIVTGVRLRSSLFINVLVPRCRVYSTSPTPYTSAKGIGVGGSGGEYGYYYCPRGQYIRGMKFTAGYFAEVVNSLRIFCSDGSNLGVSRSFGYEGGRTYYYWCPKEYPAVKGIRAKQGSLINKIGLTCSTVNGMYSAPLIVYELPNTKGKAQGFWTNSNPSDLEVVGDNDISSVRLAIGYRAELSTNADGSGGTVILDGSSNTGRDLGSYWGTRISHVEVERR